MRASKKPYPRAARVSESIREVLAVEIDRLADSDERLAHLTVTAVEVSADMARATLFFDRLGEQAREALEEVRPQLQRLLFSQMRWKRIPRLGFEQDETVLRAERVEAIIARLRKEREQRHD